METCTAGIDGIYTAGKPKRIVATRYVCSLPEGHAEWHKDERGYAWMYCQCQYCVDDDAVMAGKKPHAHDPDAFERWSGFKTHAACDAAEAA